jgi:hypothetical protein
MLGVCVHCSKQQQHHHKIDVVLHASDEAIKQTLQMWEYASSCTCSMDGSLQLILLPHEKSVAIAACDSLSTLGRGQQI